MKKEEKLIELPGKLELQECPEDGLVLKGNRWVPFDYLKWARRTAKVTGEVNTWDLLPADGGFEVVVNGWISEGNKKQEKHFVKLKVTKILCKMHQMMKSGYYVSIIQLRGGWTGEVFHEVEHRLSRIQEKDRMAFFREKPVKGGLDVYIGSKQAAWKVAQELKNKYKAKVAKSTKIVGRKDGRDLKRLIISVRFPDEKPVANLSQRQVGKRLFKEEAFK